MDFRDFNDPNFINTNAYKNFIDKNKSVGYLNIRAYAANAAIPISGLNITISKVINNEKVIFFEGATDSSGIINRITLPTPILSKNDLKIPESEEYDIMAVYENQSLYFKVLMYSNIVVNQNINIVPNMRLDGKNYGN